MAKKGSNKLKVGDKEVDIEKLSAVSPHFWLERFKVQLSGGEVDFGSHFYQVDWLLDKSPRQCWMKGAQMGVSEMMVVKVLHGLIYGVYPRGFLYLFPTRDDVTDFSKGRFQPLIAENGCIGRHVRDTDAANIKRIGRAMLYLRGARATAKIGDVKKSSSQLKCHDNQTEILTYDGWKSFSDLSKGELVATQSPTGEFMWQKITDLYSYDYSGQMLLFKSKSVDFCVTPNHRLLLSRPNLKKKWFELAKEASYEDLNVRVVRVIDSWKGSYPDFILIDQAGKAWIKVRGNRINSRWEPRHSDRLIKLEDWVAFLGLYISEGSVEGITKGVLEKGKGRVTISQVKSSKHLQKIKALLFRMPFKWKYDGKNFRANDKELAKLMFPLGSKYNKQLPKWVLNLPARFLRILWEYAVIGDGHVGKNGFESYASVSKKLVDQLQEILHKCGYDSTIKKYASECSYIKGRKIKGTVPIYILFKRTTKASIIPVPQKVEYNDKVWCVSVPNGVILTRRNGRTLWSGNSIPVDGIAFDERDEMDDDMVELALQRMAHSDVKHEFYFSTPTIPDYGIDRLYSESDQRVWMIKCRKCGSETCLELEFPECLGEMEDGRVLRLCRHCRSEIFPVDGRWVAQYPDRSKDLVGWWISQLNSLKVDPGYILKKFRNPPNGNLAEVYNSMLGMAYINVQDRLTKEDVYACCGRDGLAIGCDHATAMGVDVGKVLHVVIGYRVAKDVYKVIYLARVSDFNDVHDIAKRFKVRYAVIDIEPETRTVKDFQAAEPYYVYLCDYIDSLKGVEQWDDDKGIVKVNRTEICDATHHMVTTAGRLVIPRRSSEVDEFVKEMCNIARVLEEDDFTGSRKFKYKKLGPDHYRHALNYMKLAADQLPIQYDEDYEVYTKRRRGVYGFVNFVEKDGTRSPAWQEVYV